VSLISILGKREENYNTSFALFIPFRLWLKEESTRGDIKEIAKNIDGLIDEERCDLLKGFIKEAQRLNIFKLLESGTDISYDQNGNVLSITHNEEGDFYEYDEFNRLKRVTSYGIVIGEYFYDSMNRRVLKRSFSQEIIYLYDIFGNLISEVDSKTGNLIRDYIYVGSRPIVMVHYTPPPEQPPPPSSGCVISKGGKSVLEGIFIILMLLMFLYIGKREKGKAFLMFVLFSGILSMMCLEEEKDYMSEEIQNPEPCEPLDEPVQNFEKPETPQDPVEPFIIHTNPGKENLYYYHLDHLGTPLKLTDENGNVVWSMNCSPFMEICSINGDIIQPLRFPGQYYDEETSLHYNWNRYNKPEWGRYVEPDPSINRPFYNLEGKGIFFLIDELKEHPETLTPYLYASNKPMNFIDPAGLVTCCATWKEYNIQGCCECEHKQKCGKIWPLTTGYAVPIKSKKPPLPPGSKYFIVGVDGNCIIPGRGCAADIEVSASNCKLVRITPL